MKFDLILKEIFSTISESIFLESGNAINGVTKIKKENIPATLQLLENKVFIPLGIKRSSWDIIGSTGKKSVSGDIDIAIDINAVLKETNSESEQEFAQKIIAQCEKLNWPTNNRINSGSKMIHLGIPIFNQKNEMVQVDLMIANDMKFTKFKYFSPSEEESKYKGALRSILIDCILKYATLEAAEDATDEEKQSYTAPDGKVYPYIRFQHLAFNTNGLWKNVKTLKGKKGFLSIPKKDKEVSKFLTSDINEILKLLFGENTFKISDFNSFESIWNNVLFSEKFPYKNKIKDIVIGFLRSLKENNNNQKIEQNKISLPEEVIEYCELNNINIDDYR